MRLSILIIVAILLIANIASAELPLSVDFKFYETYVDNIFQTSTPIPDYVSLMYLDALYGLGTNTLINYNSNFNLFNDNSDLHNNIHFLGLDHERSVFKDNGALNFGLGLGLKNNSTDYEYYDYRVAGAYTDLKYLLTDTAFAKIGYQIEYKDHQNYDSISFLENSGLLQLSKTFSTRTTLQLFAETGRREYVNADTRDSILVSGSLKVAQSLTDLTGLQLQYTRHYVPENENIMSYLQAEYYGLDDLEDEYSYSGNQGQMTLKRIAPWNMMLKGTLSRETRDYNEFYLLDGIQKRKDTSTTVLLEVEKRFYSDSRFIPDTALHIQFLHKYNNSTNPEYDSSTNILSIGTHFAF